MKNKAWSVTIIVFLTGVVFAIGNFKVPPTMVAVLEEMNTGITMGGWLMSLGAIAGIILALPAGGIIVKTGPKKLGLFSLVCAIIGNVIGALAPNFRILMLGRLIEGIGFGLIGVVAPAIIAGWFPPEKRGLPMAVWSVWVGVGMLVIFNATNVILPIFGWRGDWWLAAGLAVLMLILFAWGVEVPVSERKEDRMADSKSAKSSIAEGFKSPASWLLAIVFAIFGFGCGALMTFIPTYLVEAVDMDMVTANSYSSLITVGMIAGGIIMGFVLNMVKNRSLLLLVSMIVTGIFMVLNFEVSSPQWIMPFMLACGFAYSMVPAVAFTVAPDAASTPATIGITMGIVILGQNLAAFIAPVLIGAIVEGSGGVWGAATMPLFVAALIGILAAILYVGVMKRRLVK